MGNAMGFQTLTPGTAPLSLAWTRNGASVEIASPPQSDVLVSLAGIESMDQAEIDALVQTAEKVRTAGGVLVIHALSPNLLEQFHRVGLGANLIAAADEGKARRMAEKFHELAKDGRIPTPPEGYAEMLRRFDPEYRHLITLVPPAPPELEAEILEALRGPRYSMEEVLAELFGERG
jgi:anti-anti-sigma regulatory factor